MTAQQRLAERFDEHRAHLRAVAYRMLGSLEEADDAVQEAWIRLSRTDPDQLVNLGGWLTTVTARICLDLLRVRAARREQPAGFVIPDPIVSRADGTEPEQEALVAESVGLALQVVMESLNPAQRIAFVLHDIFAVPYEEIGTILHRSTPATKQLASRARARVRAEGPPADGDVAGQHRTVRAFFDAARNGDFDALLNVLAPDVVLRSDGGGQPERAVVLRGAGAVARQVVGYFRGEATIHPALVNGAAGVVLTSHGKARTVIGFTVRDGRISAIDGLADPRRIERLSLPAEYS